MAGVATIRTIDMKLLDELLGMTSGYLLDFSDRTMREFFEGELQIDIDHSSYSKEGTSKAKRFRCFLRTVDPPSAARTLRSLWRYRQGLIELGRWQPRASNDDEIFASILDRISTPSSKDQVGFQEPAALFPPGLFAKLSLEYSDLHQLEPQARGYRFERFLYDLFAAFGLDPREPFRLRGEQIDGSFVLHHEIYLLEAKWQANRTDAMNLRAFEAKVSDKSQFTRGLFVSYGGFTEEGLDAFGRGKRTICVDGLDIHECLTRSVPIDELISRKLRATGETGRAFIPFRDLNL